MPSFLSPEWFADGPDGTTECHLAPAPGGLALGQGALADADARLRVPFEIAVAMFVDHDLGAAMGAFADGTITLEGDASQLFALEQAASDNPAAADLQSEIRRATAESARADDDVPEASPVADPLAYARPGRPEPRERRTARPNILLVTTDQQRFDSLGAHGSGVCSTPAIDGLLATATDYLRAHVQNVLCTPSRSTILTGQYPGTHGVWSNGVALPQDAPSIADVLADAGYVTAHIGKQHFEPSNTLGAYLAAIDADQSWAGPYRGFDRVESADHFHAHGTYPLWLREQLGRDAYRDHMDELLRCFRGRGGETDAPQCTYSSLPAELHSSTWIVDRAIDWIGDVGDDQSFFCWASFDDPHHPFNPPADYGRRHPWTEIPLPRGRPDSREAIEAALASKPWQYGAYWRGEFSQHEGAAGTHPATVTDDQLREITALTAGMIELIDDNVGRLLAFLSERGRDEDTHVFFTSDHGELLGDHGLLLKGPFHVDALMHVALAWHRPGGHPATVTDPVGLVDLAPTFCSIAGIEMPEWMEGEPLPARDGERERVVTVFDSAYRPELRLRTMFRDEQVVTVYPRMEGVGELYDLRDDPHQFENRWDDPSRRSARDELVGDLVDHVVEDRRGAPLRWWQHA